MSTQNSTSLEEVKPKEMPKADIATIPQSPSERFTNAVIKQFSSDNGQIQLTTFQKKLCQNYFIKIDQTLKDNEKKRMAKSEQYRDALAFTWENVNMNKLAIDVIAYSSVEMDPTQPNHINMIPYKNTANNKYDMGFIIGYNGMEIKAKKYGLEVPDSVIVELVYSTDKFKQIKKDLNNKIETYTFETTNDFNRGDVVGGFWFHEFKENPEKNKIKVFSLKDIEKRKPKYASADFWGGLKDVWDNGKKVGTEKIDGWFEEMAFKTLSRAAYNAIVIDSKKIDDNYMAIIQKETDMADAKIENEILTEANKESLTFEDAAETIEFEVVEPTKDLVENELQNSNPVQKELFTEEKKIDSDEEGPGF